MENGAIVNDTLLVNITYEILKPFYTKTKYFSLKNGRATNEHLEFFKSKEYMDIYMTMSFIFWIYL
ncbi:hypothetical protein CBLAS_0350 [Campylobacter blaseri]|uniref:Uncharacterized protein n=1 Tax=Campylobacter blaseri TaxID=2042961 RepID=A0A2P8R1G9_9BACT|nr:hypothetical protein [Campylobacter blaseri]PSM52347.1 hypothetical protein CQ405_04660 [Campylobacter blaseri]PSM54113.1 hypothetical protein CRN67_04660 [Campylobacter blaseri]QKF85557.1 hypothetical protein CBLAS_0350 [Campylobacter blaseri]